MAKPASNENEVALFFRMTPESVAVLRNWQQPYLQITQSETNATTTKGQRVTLRVRRTETINGDGAVLYEGATKYRLPWDPKTLTSKCAEQEKVITEEDYALALPFGERLYQKRRFLFDLIPNLGAELDWYVDKSNMDYGEYCKMDINTPPEGFSPQMITGLLKHLPKHGIVIADLINPPWIQSKAIGQRIGELMEKRWNLL